MTKFKVGDKVRVKKNLKVEEFYNECRFASDMEKYCGEIMTIRSAWTLSGQDRYNLDSVASYSWSNDMLEGCNISSIDDLQFGDILTLRNGERYIYADDTMYGEDKLYHCDRDIVKASFTDDLKRDTPLREYDIIKVEREGQVVYEREDVREMTVEEISKALGYEVKVVK